MSSAEASNNRYPTIEFAKTRSHNWSFESRNVFVLPDNQEEILHFYSSRSYMSNETSRTYHLAAVFKGPADTSDGAQLHSTIERVCVIPVPSWSREPISYYVSKASESTETTYCFPKDTKYAKIVEEVFHHHSKSDEHTAVAWKDTLIDCFRQIISHVMLCSEGESGVAQHKRLLADSGSRIRRTIKLTHNTVKTGSDTYAFYRQNTLRPQAQNQVGVGVFVYSVTQQSGKFNVAVEVQGLIPNVAGHPNSEITRVVVGPEAAEHRGLPKTTSFGPGYHGYEMVRLAFDLDDDRPFGSAAPVPVQQALVRGLEQTMSDWHQQLATLEAEPNPSGSGSAPTIDVFDEWLSYAERALDGTEGDEFGFSTDAS